MSTGTLAAYRSTKPAWVVAGVTYLVALGVFAYFAAVVVNFPWEVTVSTTVQSWRSAWLDTTMRVVSELGVLEVAAPLVAITAVTLFIAGWRAEGIFMVLTSSAGRLVTLVVKGIVDRPRPSEDLVQVLQDAASASFPSGHVVHSVVYLGALAVVLNLRLRPSRRLRTAQALIVALVLATGLSRIYLGMHWLGDVVGGFAFGAAVVAAAVWTWRAWPKPLRGD
ncbi:MAG: phosphatase PAP2 family protein [Chloroflexi bacterium]|nr:phosphatase PAP2 family protein [Chloroflexota bacterium]